MIQFSSSIDSTTTAIMRDSIVYDSFHYSFSFVFVYSLTKPPELVLRHLSVRHLKMWILD